MAAQINGYDYDIFISYRHKDNKYDGWVSEFVANLRKELEATFKEDVSVYFDENADDGLKESHDVDDSLKSKLNCLVFIPIISQTYCDPKSFAWQHEFVYFKQKASCDQVGLKVKLANANVASRILPIRIHEIDQSDKEMLEHELGTALRPIDFIFKSSGVNRPMRPQDDERHDSENHVLYRNQINKVANAIKEVIGGVKQKNAIRPQLGPEAAAISETRIQNKVPQKTRKRLAYGSLFIVVLLLILYGAYAVFAPKQKPDSSGKSIAVLPFENMSNDPEQEYFSSGMTEDILNHLTKISDLEVKSRTSTLQYKGTTKTVSEIGDELGVANVVEGSVRRVGDKVRIVVQLIDAKKDIHLWSETYDRDFEDVLSLQSRIAIEIAKTLEATLTTDEKENIIKEEAHDVTAYDYYLRAREELNTIQYSKNELSRLKDLVDKAVSKDPDFAKAYALRAAIWFELSTFGLPQSVWVDSSTLNAQKAIDLAPDSPDGYRILAIVQRFLGELKGYERNLATAYRLAPNDLDTKRTYGWYLLSKNEERGADLIMQSIQEGFTSKQSSYFGFMFDPYYYSHDYENALKLLQRYNAMDQNSEGGYIAANITYRQMKDYAKALEQGEIAIQMNPSSSAYDNAAWAAFQKKDYEKAQKYWLSYKTIEAKFDDAGQTIPFRHRLGMTYIQMGRDVEGKKLVEEQLKIQNEILARKRGTGAWAGRGSLFYDVAVCLALLGKSDALVVQNLDSALKYEFFVDFLYGGDPAFNSIKDHSGFKKIKDRVDQHFALRKRAFAKAISNAKATRDLKNLLER